MWDGAYALPRVWRTARSQLLYYNNSGDAAEHIPEHITLDDIRLTLRVIAEAFPCGRSDADILFCHIAWHDVSL
jgi:hypothetical protein